MKKNSILLAMTSLLVLSACGGGGSSEANSSALPPKEREFTVLGNEKVDMEVKQGISMRLLRVQGNQNRKKEILAGDDELTATFQAGDEIEILSSSTHILLEAFGNEETLLYSKTGQFRIEVPKGKVAAIYPGLPKGESTISARIPSASELSEIRNLACNPFDVMSIEEYPGSGTTVVQADDSPSIKTQMMFPHAYSNVVTRGEASFFARNAIDGHLDSNGHGDYPYQSWGYDQKDEASFTLYFGRKVALSSIGITLRHDKANNHDTYWASAVIEYDGGELEIEPEDSGDEQEFEFDGDVTTDFIRIRDIVSAKTGQGYAALTEISAYGHDASDDLDAKRQGIVGGFNLKNGPAVRSHAYSAEEVKENADRANAWFLDALDKGSLKVPMYDLNSTETVKLGEFEWKDSIYYSGMSDYILTTGDQAGYDYLKGIGEAAKYRCNSGTYTPHGDHYQIGETFMNLGDIASTSYQAAQPRSNLDWNVAAYPNVPPKVSGDHRDENSRDWSHLSFWWCDALYMALNSYTLMSKITGEDKYVTTAKAGYDYAKGFLYDQEDHLWHRDLTQLSLTNSQDEGAKHKVYWARGNAWVFAALAKELIYLDEADYPEIYDDYLNDYLEMAEALAEHQKDDGLWDVSITPYDKYSGKEITGTCGFLYGYCVGLALGVLDEATYLPMVEKGFETIYETCFINGTDQLGYMQTVGYQPQNYVSEEFSKVITNEFGMGLFLLASSAFMRLCDDYEAVPLLPDAGAQGYYYS